MKLELDHFFILVEPEAKVANLLVELGLEESFSRDHLGQGTSNRCFSFSNSKLELLWVRDENEANSGPANRLRFPERSSNKMASPFGLVFKRKANSKKSSDLEMPFKGWRYQPDYFPEPMAFHVGSNSENLIEPLCIYVPFMEPAEKQVEPELRLGKFRCITNVHLHVPVVSQSKVLLIASQTEGLSVESGEEHLIEVFFDENICGLSKDLRPNLPLILHW